MIVNLLISFHLLRHHNLINIIISTMLLTFINYGFIPFIYELVIYLASIIKFKESIEIKKFFYNLCYLDKIDEFIQKYINPPFLRNFENYIVSKILLMKTFIWKEKKEKLEDLCDTNNDTVDQCKQLLKKTLELPNNDDNATVDDVKKMFEIFNNLSGLTKNIKKNIKKKKNH